MSRLREAGVDVLDGEILRGRGVARRCGGLRVCLRDDP